MLGQFGARRAGLLGVERVVDGAIIEQGRPEQIMSQPEQPRTQKFLSAVLGR